LRLARFNFIIVAVYLVIILVFVPTPFAASQIPRTSKYGIKITYPSDGELVSVGELTIFGIVRYETTSNACTVYADWNDSQPMQKVTPAGLNSLKNKWTVWKE
jgi:hypothetical protein